MEEVRTYAASVHPDLDPEEFVSFYESKGWMVGKNRMKDWQAAVRTWKAKYDKNRPKTERELFEEQLDRICPLPTEEEAMELLRKCGITDAV